MKNPAQKFVMAGLLVALTVGVVAMTHLRAQPQSTVKGDFRDAQTAA